MSITNTTPSIWRLTRRTRSMGATAAQPPGTLDNSKNSLVQIWALIWKKNWLQDPRALRTYHPSEGGSPERGQGRRRRWLRMVSRRWRLRGRSGDAELPLEKGNILILVTHDIACDFRSNCSIIIAFNTQLSRLSMNDCRVTRSLRRCWRQRGPTPTSGRGCHPATTTSARQGRISNCIWAYHCHYDDGCCFLILFVICLL